MQTSEEDTPGVRARDWGPAGRGCPAGPRCDRAL